jgi:hypothetical protein
MLCVIVLGVVVTGGLVLDGAGFGVVAGKFVPMRCMVLMPGVAVHVRSGSGLDLGHQAGGGVAERQRCPGREHAKQIEQGGKPPRFDALPSRQANGHGSRLAPIADSAKVTKGVVPSHLHAQYRAIVA